jgi:hypothetical protein
MDRLSEMRRRFLALAGRAFGGQSDLLWLAPLAIAVRLFALIYYPSLHHPDENYQVFEQAHRLAFGYGVVPWEFDDGIRSYVLPYLFSLIYRAAAFVKDSPDFYIFWSRFFLITLSTLPVIVAYVSERRRSRLHAVILAFVCAIWFELIYFSGRPLTEAVACDFLLSAACLAVTKPSRPGTLVALGFLMAMAFCLRYHLVLGLGVLALAVSWRDPIGRGRFLILGAAAPLAVFGLTDWLTWGYPFASMINSIHVNLIENKSSQYGIRDNAWFFWAFFNMWGPVFPLLAILLLCAMRRYVAWIVAALAIIGMHSLIQHKEYRFVYPAFALLALAAAGGSAELIAFARDRLKMRGGSVTLVTGAACGIWATISVSLASADTYRAFWFQSRSYLEAFSYIRRDEGACGILLPESNWGRIGGYAYFHRRVPIYAIAYKPRFAAGYTDSFNVAVVRRSMTGALGGRFHASACFDSPGAEDVCVIERPGGCIPNRRLRSLLQLRRLGDPTSRH